MACSKKTKVMILSLLMILVLLTTWTVAPLSYSHAVLAELIVTGEVVMTLATLASLMMIAFGASGMDGAVRNQAAATGTQPLTYVGQLLNRWLSSGASNLGFSTLATKMQEGLSYLPDGTLYLDSDATAAVADFQRWAWDEDGANLVSFAPITEGNDGILTDANGNQVKILQFPTGLVHGDYTMQLACSNGTVNYYIGTTGSAKIVAYIERMGGVSSRSVIKVAPYATVPDGTTAGFTAVYGTWRQQTVAYWSDSRFVQVTGTFNLSGFESELPISDTSYLSFDSSGWSGGEDVIGDVDTFVGPMQQEQGTQLPLSGAVTVSADAAARLHLDNYLRAVAAAYAGSGTASVPVTDVGTGDEDTLPLSVPLDNPIGVTGVSDAAIDQSGSVAGSDAVASDFEGLDDYTMDLTQFFPFCVPFDLAYLFEKLRADPQALVIDWHFMIPYLDVDIPIQIDLSPFDSVAQLLRSLEVIAFIVALLVGTKNLIQGGD